MMKISRKKICTLILIAVLIVISALGVFADSVYFPPGQSYDNYEDFSKAWPELVQSKEHVSFQQFSNSGELVEICTDGKGYSYRFKDTNDILIQLEHPAHLSDANASFIDFDLIQMEPHLGIVTLPDKPALEDSVTPPATERYIVDVCGAQYCYVSRNDAPATLEYILFPSGISGKDDLIMYADNLREYPLTESPTLMAQLLDSDKAEGAVREMFARIKGENYQHVLLSVFILSILAVALVTYYVMRKRRGEEALAAAAAAPIDASTDILADTPPES